MKHLEFIGAYLAKAFLPLHRFNTLTVLINTIQISPQTLARNCPQWLGHMRANTFEISHTRLHMRCLQAWLKMYQTETDWTNYCRCPQYSKPSLEWWKDLQNVCAAVPFTQSPSTLILTTDASLLAWGAHLDNHMVQSKWSPLESTLHINLMELSGIRNTCFLFPIIDQRQT